MKTLTSFVKPFIFLLAMLLSSTTQATESLDFVIIQPGAPGTSAEAAPVMEELASYLQKKVGVPIHGQFFNEIEPALTYLDQKKANWGIVTLGFYLTNYQKYPMTPFASTHPNGLNKDTWHLLVKYDGSSDWKTLNGIVSGNLLFTPEPVAQLTFAKSVTELPFTFNATPNMLQAMRNVVRGKAAGVMLDQVQLDTTKSLDIYKQLKLIHSSQPLPTSPVVWFGTPGTVTDKIRAALKNMKDDQEAKSLLDLLRTQGFDVADTTISSLATSASQSVTKSNKKGK